MTLITKSSSKAPSDTTKTTVLPTMWNGRQIGTLTIIHSGTTTTPKTSQTALTVLSPDKHK